MKQSELKHKFGIGDTVRYRAAHISGDGSRQHHYDWAEDVVEKLGRTKPTLKSVDTGEVRETENAYGLVMREKVCELQEVRLPTYCIDGRWYGASSVRKV